MNQRTLAFEIRQLLTEQRCFELSGDDFSEDLNAAKGAFASSIRELVGHKDLPLVLNVGSMACPELLKAVGVMPPWMLQYRIVVTEGLHFTLDTHDYEALSQFVHITKRAETTFMELAERAA